LVNEEVAQSLRLSLAPDGFGPSDHSSFYGKGIPVLHFFTNTHADYHRPTDDWELINREGLQLVADMVAGITRRLTGTSQITATGLTPIEGGGGAHAGLPPSSSDDAPTTSGYGPYFGSIPDMTPLEFGVRLTGVREDSPAEKAGVRAGDIVVEFGGQEVSDLYAYTYALREHAAGDEVTVVVLREGERVTLTAVLVSR
jgi:membrane-associated protease RseP (regulator of RpoE activity)